jgi:uncharacterized membrane protein YgcG
MVIAASSSVLTDTPIATERRTRLPPTAKARGLPPRIAVSKWLRLIAPLAVLLVLATPALAQSGELIYHDEAGKLDRARVEQAAQPLIARGARVAIYTVDSSTDSDGENDFLQRLEEDGLASGGSVDPNLVAIYVSFNPRYAEIRGGDHWNEGLKTNNNIDTIRREALNPGLAADDTTGGFVEALRAINSAIENPLNPKDVATTDANVSPPSPTIPIAITLAALIIFSVSLLRRIRTKHPTTPEIGASPPLKSSYSQPKSSYSQHHTSMNITNTGQLQQKQPEVSRRKLYDILTKHFNKEDLIVLCFELDVDYEDIPGEGKTRKVVELTDYIRTTRTNL